MDKYLWICMEILLLNKIQKLKKNKNKKKIKVGEYKVLELMF